jgi:hypothetical protein
VSHRTRREPSSIRSERTRAIALAIAGLVCAVLALVGRVNAGRPLLDRHQWDSYFALFARDVAVPWKPTTIRLDTYSGARVDFAAYAVDPAEVIVAGANRSARAIDTSRLKPAIRWSFSPPQGYRFVTSNVPVPLGSSEGFFVIEARRGDAAQQVWLNRTRIGLLSKESPEGLVIWGADLRTGRALRGLHVALLVGSSLVTRVTDNAGLLTWRGNGRPVFALADSGGSRAFLSFLPQAPMAPAVVAVRVASAVVRTGDAVHVVGFARRRANGVYRRATGDARLTLVGHGRTIASADPSLDGAGAFVADLRVPEGTEAGDYALLASAGGGVAGTTVHVDAASDVVLTIAAACPCAPGADIPVRVTATRGQTGVGGIPVTVEIVRTPHLIPPGESDETARWGTTVVTQMAQTTDSAGHARVVIPPPTDGLASTYGIRASTQGNGATATSRLVVPTAPVALAVEPDGPAVDLGQSAGFTITGFSAVDGTAAAGLEVTVSLSHGATVTQQSVRLDDRGRARVVYRSPSVGTNLAVAQATVSGKTAFDAASIVVAPESVSGRSGAVADDVAMTLDRTVYRPGDRIGVTASAPGASGEALVTLEGARTYQSSVVPVRDGRASASLAVGTTEGDVKVGVAFVRDGAIVYATQPVTIEAPGHAIPSEIGLDRSTFAAGDVAKVAIHGGSPQADATIVVRVSDGDPTGAASFDDVGGVLRSGGTTSQDSASESPAWHAWVAPARSKAGDIFAADRPRQVRTTVPSIGAAAPRTAVWVVAHPTGNAVDVTLPRDGGGYVLSVLEIFDDGSVAAGRAGITVK